MWRRRRQEDGVGRAAARRKYILSHVARRGGAEVPPFRNVPISPAQNAFLDRSDYVSFAVPDNLAPRPLLTALSCGGATAAVTGMSYAV